MVEPDDLAVELEFFTEDESDRELAISYWERKDDGCWTYTVKEVSRLTGVAQHLIPSRLRQIARARDPQISCIQCELGLIVSSRTDFDTNRRYSTGRDRVCSACEEEAKSARDRAVKEKQERLEASARAQFQLIDREPVNIESMSFRHAISLLALLRNPIDEEFTSSIPLSNWKDESYAARLEDGKARVTELWRAGILVVHPSTPLAAFGWVAGKDGSENVGIYVDKVRWTASGTGSTKLVNSNLVKALRRKLAGKWPEVWLESWADEWDKTMLEEAIAYFELIMADHNFEFSPGERTRQVLSDALNYYPLGAIYNFIWRAAKDSAAYYQRGGVPKKQAANSAVGRIERSVEMALAKEWEITSYRRDRRLPWSAVSNTLFITALQISDPMTTLPTDLTSIGLEPDTSSHVQETSE